MTKNIFKVYSTKETAQDQPIPGKDMVKGPAGGFVFEVGDWERLEKFLVIGVEGGTYYVDQKPLTIENAEATRRCIEEDGPRVVARVVEISEGGKAANNDQALFALAMCAKFGDRETRQAAYAAWSKVARIGTHLFHLNEYVRKNFGLSGRGIRTANARWYNDMQVDKLAYQVTKYRQRDGWTHRDVLRLSHPIPVDESHSALYHWVTQNELKEQVPELIRVFEAAQEAKTPGQIIELIEAHKLAWEVIPTDLLKSPEVWQALLPHMPLTALIRNLGRMTANEAIKPLSGEVAIVTEKLADVEYIHKSRLHPIAILAALHTYRNGKGFKSSLQWEPVGRVVDALDGAFYKAFDNVEPTGKNIMLALDLSGSMTWLSSMIPRLAGMTCRDAAACLAMVTARTEPNYLVVGFTGFTRSLNVKNPLTCIQEIPISPRQRLDDIIATIDKMGSGGTDCSLPVLYAMSKNLRVDAFVLYTDSDTWAGAIHPCQALAEYRRQTGIDAKMVVVGMVSEGFSIADSSDPGMLDIIGFSTSTPKAISNFIRN